MAVGLLGCGESEPASFPVEGKVTIDGKPAEEGGVIFHDGMKRYVGAIKSDGSYSMMHNGQPGVPRGKYKATVAVTMTPKDAQGNPTDLPKTLSNARYMNPQATPLEVTVTEAPPAGAYDLAVKH